MHRPILCTIGFLVFCALLLVPSGQRCVWGTACSAGKAYADHSTLRNDTFNTLPNFNAAAPNAPNQQFLDHESAQREGRYHPPFIYSGGIHGTSSTLISPAFATEAFVPEHLDQSSILITYDAISNDVCWTIISSDNNGITGWTRVGTTAYYYHCEGDTTPTKPDLPPNSAWLMMLTISGNAITAVTDLRESASYAYTGAYLITDPLYGAVADDTTDNCAALTALVTNIRGSTATALGGKILIPRGRYTTSCWPSMDDSIGIIIEGNASVTGGSVPDSRITYTGTGTFFSARSTAGFTLKNIYINGLSIDASHYLIDTSHSATGGDSAFVRIEESVLTVATTTAGIVNFDKTNSSSVAKSHLTGGVFGIRGAATSASYANAITIDKVEFHNNQYAIQNANQAWVIQGNTFEGTGANFVGAYTHTGGHCNASPVVFLGNWYGDSPATTVWNTVCGAFTALNNTFASGQEGFHVMSSNPAIAIGNTYGGAGFTGLVFDTAFADDVIRFLSLMNLNSAGATEYNLNSKRPYIGHSVHWDKVIGSTFFRALEIIYGALGGSDSVFIGPSILAPTGYGLNLMTNGNGSVLIRNYSDGQDVTLQAGTGSAQKSRIILSPLSKDNQIEFQTGDTRRARLSSNGLTDIGPAVQTITNNAIIIANACGGVKQIASDAAVDTSAATPFTAGSSANTSCIMHVCNTGGFTITIKHAATFFTTGAGDISLAASCCIVVLNAGTTWYQTTPLQCSS